MAPEYINGDYIAGAIMPLRKCINRVCIIAKKKRIYLSTSQNGQK